MKTSIIVNAELPTNKNYKNDTRCGFIEMFENSCCLCLFSSNALPCQVTKFFLQIIRQSRCESLIDSHACMQTLYSSKLNIVAWVVELTYLNVTLVDKCHTSSGGHSKARCAVTFHYQKLEISLLHSLTHRIQRNLCL